MLAAFWQSFQGLFDSLKDKDVREVLGWIGGGIVVIVGGLWTVFTYFWKKPEPHGGGGITFNAPVSPRGGTNVIGSQNVTLNITGYTVEQHEQRLKAREQELREAFQATLGQSEERRKTVERELQGVQGQVGNLQKSYEERVAELKRVAGELEALRGQIPDAKLQEALEALEQGKTKLAYALFAEIASKGQSTIELVARAEYEQGRIAYQEVRWQEARSHFEKADRLIPDHDEYSVWAAQIAHVLGDYGTAARRYEAILERIRREKGEDSSEMAEASNGLATLYQDQGRYGEAEPLYKKAIAIDEKTLPADHPKLAAWYNNLAGLYWKQGRYGEAEPLFKKALEILERRLGPRHPSTVTVSTYLAALLRSQGHSDEADALLQKFGAGMR